MRRTLPFLLALVLAGCSSNKDVATQEPAPQKAPAPSPTTTPPPLEPKAGENINRAFQLASLDKRTLKVNGKAIDAWIMDSEPKRMEGMMFLTNKDVRDDQGMLFVFANAQKPSDGFWMHNTLIPLDIVYIASDKKVINIQRGKPQNDTSLPASGSYFYTLELKGGQAEKLGIKPGTPVEIPNDLHPVD